jgi:hypothetical protein
MIPEAYIQEWRETAPWRTIEMVEQDLMLSRALVDIFASKRLSEWVAFRGGTALHKLFFASAQRYSEDIDLVQKASGPIGPIYDEIQAVLNPWLGKPSRKRGHGVELNLQERFRVPAICPSETQNRDQHQGTFCREWLCAGGF